MQECLGSGSWQGLLAGRGQGWQQQGMYDWPTGKVGAAGAAVSTALQCVGVRRTVRGAAGAGGKAGHRSFLGEGCVLIRGGATLEANEGGVMGRGRGSSAGGACAARAVGLACCLAPAPSGAWCGKQ